MLHKLNPLNYRRKHPLAFRLLMYILFVSSLATLLATAFQIVTDYNKDISSIEKRFEEINLSHSKSLAANVWNYDEEQIYNILNGILMLPDIEFIEINSSGDIFLVGERPEKKSIISRKYDFPPIEDVNDLGSVLIIASLDNVYKRLRERLIVILASQGIKTFIVSFFILLIIRMLITRHLVTMADFTRKLNLNELDQLLVLDRKKHKHLDELDRVTFAINNMITNLDAASREMETQARMQGELDAAATIQKACTPKELPHVENFEMAAKFHPAREMSGDYFDVIQVNERYVIFVIADVSGKGVSAAMYANIARVLIRDKEELQVSPIKLLNALNNSLKKELHSNHFLTLCYAVLDLEKSSITYANAGHEPLLLIRPDHKEVAFLKPSGYPFSDLHADMFENRLSQDEVTLETGDVLFFYTDGLTDIENEQGEMLGEERLYSYIEELSHLSAMQIHDKLFERLSQFKGSAEQTDDMTMIVLKKNMIN